MATNPYFNKNYSSQSEQDLYDDLMEESIKIHGIDVQYLPREIQKIDSVFKDVEVSQFTTTHEIEMFIDSVEQFGGEGDFLSKFGVEIRDTLELTVMVNRFQTLNIGRPKEGDLIFFPFNKQLFEVMFVEDEQIFYTLGKKFVYRLKLELFEYSNQMINTGIEDIDNIQYENAYSIELTTTNGTGDYVVGENAFQGTDLASATAKGRVASWANNTLELIDVVGKFVEGVNVVGDAGASYEIDLPDSYEDVELDMPNDPLSDNLDYEKEADEVIDFSENNPFSEEDY
jgi:hypothetical protein|tara:strand:- start:92 stop:949 length:858 start_codon:yes stop_codon:yes gene_type:complete